jgi:hypothetical protein
MFPFLLVSELSQASDTSFSLLTTATLNRLYPNFKVEVTLRPTVSRSVLVSGTHLGPATNFSFSLKFSLDRYGFVIFVAPSLTRGRVCNLLLLLGLTSTVPLWCESRGTQDHILLSKFLRLPQPGGPGPRIYVPQEQGGPVIPPGTGFLSRRLLQLELSLSYDRRSVDQFVLVSGSSLGPMTRFYPFLSLVTIVLLFFL